MEDEFAIKVESISKTFRLPHEKNTSIKDALINIYKRNKSYDNQQVLKDISFEIKKGEFFGIVGRNGSGKSTLLKLLAGIYSPDSGSVQVNGKLTPFIELGVGFSPELTGRENVFLNGALLGFNRKEMHKMYEDIVAFAELEEFMDQKLKNYSSGMQVRLAFSVATRANTDILLIDEVLAVGDQSFQEKCFDYFSKIKKSGKTVIFVTHDMSNVERFCDRVFVIDKKKEANGMYTIPEAIALYNQLNHERAKSSSVHTNRDTKDADVYIKSVELLDKEDKPREAFDAGSPLTIEIKLGSRLKKALPIIVGLAFHDKDGANLSGPNSIKVSYASDVEVIRYSLDHIPFGMGDYYLTVALFDDNLAIQYDILDKGIQFFINDSEVRQGKFILPGKWS